MKAQIVINSEIKALEAVINNTIKTLDNSTRELMTAAGHARNEYQRLKDQFPGLEEKIANAGGRELEELQDRWRHLETQLSELVRMAEKAEGLADKVQLVMDLLKENPKDINSKIEQLQQKQQLGLQIIKAQEEERKRVSREIHDGPAQSLANVVFRMEYCEKLLELEPEKVKDELAALKKVVRDNLQDVRKIIYDLRPMALDDLGIIPALKRYINNYQEEKGINVEFSFSGKDVRFDTGLEVALFRIIQEALTNVAKHAAANHVLVGLEMRDDFISAFVEDDGRGLDIADLSGSKAGKFGLVSMKERAELLGGELRIDASPGRGAKISLRLPINSGNK